MDWILVIVISWGMGKGSTSTVEHNGPFSSKQACEQYAQSSWRPGAEALYLREKGRGIHIGIMADCMRADQVSKMSWPVGTYND